MAFLQFLMFLNFLGFSFDKFWGVFEWFKIQIEFVENLSLEGTKQYSSEYIYT